MRHGLVGIPGLFLSANMAAGQAGTIYAPCLQGDDVAGLTGAFREAGWQDVTGSDEITAAIGAISQTAYAIASLPRRFETRSEATEYVTAAVGWLLRNDPETSPVFRNGDVYAMALDFGDTETRILQCSLSAAEFPEAETLLQANSPITGLTGGTAASAVTFATFTLETETGTDAPQSIDIVRLEAEPNALSVLTGRYGIILFRRFERDAD